MVGLTGRQQRHGGLRPSLAAARSQVPLPATKSAKRSSCHKTSQHFSLVCCGTPENFEEKTENSQKMYDALQKISKNAFFWPQVQVSGVRSRWVEIVALAAWLAGWCDKTSPALFPLLLWTHMCTLFHLPCLDFMFL